MNKLCFFLFYVALSSLISSCAVLGPFSPKPGMTTDEVSKAAYVPCDGHISPSKKNIVFVQKHPEAPSVDIYRTVADYKYNRGAPECRKDLHFYQGRLISDDQLAEIIATGDLITKFDNNSNSTSIQLDDIKKKLSRKSYVDTSPIKKSSSDYLTLSPEGTFSTNCNATSITNAKNYSIERIAKNKQNNQQKIVEYTFISRDKNGDRKRESSLTREDSTGLYTEIIDQTYKNREQIQYLLVKDDYVRMLLLNSTKDKISAVLTKCSNSLTKNTIIEPSDDETFSNAESNSFEIKDLIIGEKLTNDKCKKGLVTMQTFEKKTLQKCSFDTSILQVPYQANVFLINTKIVSVEFEALHIDTGKNNSEYAAMFHEIRIPIGTIDEHIESLIGKIKEKLGEPSVSKKTVYPEQINESDYKCEESVLGSYATWSCNQKLNNAIKTFKKQLTNDCGKCDLTEYSFTWNDRYKVKVLATVPKFKKTPGGFSDISISYTTKENINLLQDYMQRSNQDVIRAQNHENYREVMSEFNKKISKKVNDDF